MTTTAFAEKAEKELMAFRVNTAPKIDGSLDDIAWQNIPAATDFIQLEPHPGHSSAQKTEVKVVYDNTAIYIGAMMYDTAPDSILKELSPRDGGFNNADQFSILLDTYNDGLNGFAFMVSVAGVQNDVKFSEGGEEEDGNWNAVWESKTRIVENGWVAEMKIPYSAIRFPSKKEQEWGVHFMRLDRRNREMSFWTEIDPTQKNFIKRAGKLKGISDIKAPLRLSFTPYASFGIDHYPYNIEGRSNYSYSVKGGIDLKYGLNEAFTLDMTLIPDFGQVRSDNKRLNLSPFEIRYEEHRPFFTEGTELFNKNGLFYSRRIGKTPSGYDEVQDNLQQNEIIVENPDETQLINASKISGRTKRGLGIGWFNAITANTYATLKDTLTGEERRVLTDPLTNYNIIVLDQSLKNNSYVGFINTNVSRFEGNMNANVTGVNFSLVNKKNTYAVSGSAAMSQVFTRNITEEKYDNETGHAYYLSFGKVSGNFQFELSHNVESDTYNPNDLGFLYSNNEFSNELEISYNIYKPFWKILKSENGIGVEHAALYNPLSFASFRIFAHTNTHFKNYLANGIETFIYPIESYDYFEPRTPGRSFIRPPHQILVYWFSSDYSKRLVLDGNFVIDRWFEQGGFQYSVSIGPKIRVNDRFNFKHNFEFASDKNDLGFVDKDDNGNIFFGRRNVLGIRNTFNASYIFTNKMFLSLMAYHNWTKVEYVKFFLLQENGRLLENVYGLDANNNYNYFNIDLSYSWEFAPGSTMSIVWKNIIEDESPLLVRDYFKDFSKTFDLPQNNSVSVKVLYYLDYLSIKKKSWL